MATIGQVSKAFSLPVSTLRYYDQEGLFPDISRKSGIREFGDREIETLKIVECLKKSGLEIKEIRQFMLWCGEGKKTYPLRKKLFEERQKEVEEQIASLTKTLSLLRYKCWYYSVAEKEGNEDNLKKKNLEDMPSDIREDFLASGLLRK
ncbi:MAG: MerR family transcriptional regulator [Bacilli bacterium]|jgi:DNA-binding transcriptional MerR regulator